MESLRTLLKQSLIEYALVSQAMDELQHRVDAFEPEALLRVLEGMQEIQAQAARTDAELDGRLRAQELGVAEQALLERRMQLMARILEKNRLIFARGSGMLAVRAAELNELRGARAALSGYRHGADRSGRIVHDRY